MRTAGIILYFFGLAFSEALRLPHRIAHAGSSVQWHKGKGVSRVSEFVVLMGLGLGLWTFPGIYAFTKLLDFQNYSVPDSIAWITMAVFVIGLVMRWYAHSTLAGLWAGTLELSEGHKLITTGIFGYVRHPIYTSLILWAICQPILLPNTVAGLSGAVGVLFLWLVRVPREESMMLAEFGDDYRQYASGTGRFFPRFPQKKAS